jgi:hypothetical protein
VYILENNNYVRVHHARACRVDIVTIDDGIAGQVS